MLLKTWPSAYFMMSPIVLGVFAGAFWSLVLLLTFRCGVLAKHYFLLAVYSVGATLYNAWSIRYAGASTSEPVVYATALFAGCALAVSIAAPVLTALSRSWQVLPKSGALITIGVPILLTPFVFVADHSLVGSFLLGSSILGIAMILAFINMGFSFFFSQKPRTIVVSGFLFSIPELLLLRLI